MRSSRWRSYRRIALCVTFVCALTEAQTARGRAPQDKFLTGPPFPLQEVLGALNAKVPARRILAAVESRGVTFYPSPADVSQLEAAGATGDLIQLIRTKGAKFKPAPPPPPPKPKIAGLLTLSCAPAECSVAVDGTPQGPTQGGVKKIAGIVIGPQGSVVVDFSKDGYFGQQIVVPLQPDTPETPKLVTLQPTEAMQEKLGSQLFALLVAKIGGEAGLKDSQMLTGSGTAALYDAGGQRSDWNFAARLNGPTSSAYIEMEIKLAELKWRDVIKGAVVRSGGAGKLKNTPVAKEMAQNIQQFRDYQPAAVLASLHSQKLKWVSILGAPSPSGPVTLKGTGASGEYTLTVDSNGLLESIVYQPAAGHGSGVSLRYGDYAPVGKGKAPKAFDLRYQEKTPHGLSLRFDSLLYAPNLTDKDFRT
jgi:hypothetical protein